MFGVLADSTRRYSSLESFVYDRVIAPAVADLQRALDDELLPQLKEGARVLEVGSGGGQLAVDLAKRRPDLRYTGLDLSSDQVARARERGRDQGAASLEFVEGSALDLPFEDGSFDVVLSVASLKHWPDQARGVAECVRVLKPLGRLGIVEVDRGCRFEDARRFVANWRLPAPMRPLALALFRTFVAGHSLDLDEARQLLEPLPLSEREVRRIEGTPALLLRAERQGALG